jgi:hypothetical protein
MKHADTLAALRKGRTDSTGVLEYLKAITSTLHADDPVCVVLDAAIDELEEQESCMRAVAEMRADDLDNERLRYQDRGEFDKQAMRELRRAA